MKRLFFLFLNIFIVILIFSDTSGKLIFADITDKPKPGPKDIYIGGIGILIPLGTIMLVRKNNRYCAVKIKKYWLGDNEKDKFATYEAYYQKNKKIVFSHKNTKTIKKKTF